MEDGKTALGSLSSPMWRLGWPHLFPEPARSPLFNWLRPQTPWFSKGTKGSVTTG